MLGIPISFAWDILRKISSNNWWSTWNWCYQKAAWMCLWKSSCVHHFSPECLMAELKVGHEILTLGRVVRPSPISMAGPLLPFEAFKLSVGHFFQKKVSVSAKQAALKKPHQFICMLDVLSGHMESYLVFYGFVKWIPAQVPWGPYHSAETFGGFARCCPICQRIERYRRVMGSVAATHCFPQNRWCVGFCYPAVIWMWFHTSHG